MLIAVYLAAHVSVFWLNLLGDVQRHPIVYFFTWDMFPGSYDVSTRRVAIAQTRSGTYYQVYPNAAQRFRGGVNGDMTRADRDRSGVRFRTLVEHELARQQPRFKEDPIVRVSLVEQFWPSRLNLPEDMGEAWAGQPARDVRYWRVLDTVDARP